MKKIISAILVACLLCSSGCFFATLGAATGTIVRAPFEATGYFLEGLEQGLNGTYDFGTNRDNAPTTSEKKDSGNPTIYRDSNGVLRWY
ncbi:MAG: hypothetical protein JW765_05360 [Deltaproteobacteria bacterium]|nr:hypothetical protein [Candidatus Zymogenaceae bacterium]